MCCLFLLRLPLRACCFAFLPRDAMLVRYMLSSRVHLSVCHKHVLYGTDWTNRAGFWHRGFVPPTAHTVLYVNTGNSKKNYGTFLWDFVPNSGLKKILRRQVDRVVNNACRRRRRLSLLTTPIRQSTSRVCLLQVDEM